MRRVSPGPDARQGWRASRPAAMSASVRVKWRSVILAVAIFGCLGGLTTLARGHSLSLGLASAMLTGMGVGTFEAFYVQAARGRWFRMGPVLGTSLMYLGVVVVVSVASLSLSRLLFGTAGDLPRIYERLPVSLPSFVAFSVVGVLTMRVVHHIGAGTLLHLLIGTYSRPVAARRLLMFVDMNGSTAIAERLGAFRTQALFRRFTLDMTRPIEDAGGHIHCYKGDGLIAVWNWGATAGDEGLFQAVDAMYATLTREAASYIGEFGVVPTFRIGIHGGHVVLSETGDNRRAIDIYGDAIAIASRMEEAARLHGVRCAVSGVVAGHFGLDPARFRTIGSERVKGISLPVDIYEYLVASPVKRLRRLA